MYKSALSVMALAVVLGGVSLAQATLINFESPYTIGSLDGQNGWSAVGSTVIARPSDIPASGGDQSAAIVAGANVGLTTADWTATTTVSMLLAVPSTGSAAYAEVVLSANDGTSSVPFVHLGLQHYSGGYELYAYDGSTYHYFATGLAAAAHTYQVDAKLDFTSGTYVPTFTDLSNMTTYSPGTDYAFENTITLAQAQASANLAFDTYMGFATIHVDNIGLVPEPSALALLLSAGIGLLAYAWRKRR
jgi:hypothetical protein